MSLRENLTFATEPDRTVSAILDRPDAVPTAAVVLAHGAGAGMAHPFMAAVADGLGERRIASLRFNFPFAEAGSKRPDAAPIARRTVRSAVEEARRLLPGVPMFAGGKSFGGRMTSQAQAEDPLLEARGLVFFGFPLHPAGKPAAERGAHLADVRIPMLFIQGTRDALADAALMDEVVGRIGSRATLVRVEDADHGFLLTKRSGRTDEEALAAMLDAAAAWMREAAVSA